MSAAGDVAATGAAFERFYQVQLRPLAALAYALSGGRGLAEDLAQDALLAAFNDWDRVAGLDNPGAWVRRVVANRAVSHVRRRLVEARVTSTRLRVRDGDVPTIGMLSPESEHVWAAIRRLPRRQAQVITLRTLDRSTVAEIAEILGISEEAASTHLRRARATLTRQFTRGDVT